MQAWDIWPIKFTQIDLYIIKAQAMDRAGGEPTYLIYEVVVIVVIVLVIIQTKPCKRYKKYDYMKM